MAEESPSSRRDAIVATTLAVLTIIVTLIVAVPDFLSLKSKAPLVTYAVQSAEISYPPSADKSRIKDLLDKEGIPDATITVTLGNVGEEPAKQVRASLDVPGPILVHKTTPSATDNPAWVNISATYDPSNTPSKITYDLRDMAVGPRMEIAVSYRKDRRTEPAVAVFCDGKEALPADKAAAAKAAQTKLFSRATRVFVIGAALTIIAFVLLRIRQRSELRTSAGILARAFFPFGSIITLPGQIASHKDYSHFRNRVLQALLNQPNVEFLSMSEGQLSGKRLDEFWDIQVAVHGKRVGIDVHTTSQKWDGIIGTRDDQIEFFSRIARMARKLDGIGCVIVDQADPHSPQWISAQEVVESFNRAEKDNPVVLLQGDEVAIAHEIVKMAQQVSPHNGVTAVCG